MLCPRSVEFWMVLGITSGAKSVACSPFFCMCVLNKVFVETEIPIHFYIVRDCFAL